MADKWYQPLLSEQDVPRWKGVTFPLRRTSNNAVSFTACGTRVWIPLHFFRAMGLEKSPSQKCAGMTKCGIMYGLFNDRVSDYVTQPPKALVFYIKPNLNAAC